MATLTIRNVDENTHKFLRQSAAKHGRSMEAEVREILTKTMERQQTKPGDIARSIHAHFNKIGGADDLIMPEREPAPEPIAFEK